MQDWRTQPEGQFFEHKSAWDRSGASVRRRRATDIARDVAETLSAMANADGGELVIGIEDDGEVTGVDLPDDKLAVVMDAARSRCVPPVAYGSREVMDGGLLLLHFSVDWSPEVHDLTDGRTLLRRRDQNMPFSQADVAASRRRRPKASWRGSILPELPWPTPTRTSSSRSVSGCGRGRRRRGDPHLLWPPRAARQAPCSQSRVPAPLWA